MSSFAWWLLPDVLERVTIAGTRLLQDARRVPSYLQIVTDPSHLRLREQCKTLLARTYTTLRIANSSAYLSSPLSGRAALALRLPAMATTAAKDPDRRVHDALLSALEPIQPKGISAVTGLLPAELKPNGTTRPVLLRLLADMILVR